jgi:hypothetical protein
MNQEWLGAIYCLLASVGFTFIYFMFWHLLEQTGNIIKDFRERKRKGKWK